jgi:hypothetical protein
MHVPTSVPHDMTPLETNSSGAKDIAKDWTYVNMTMKDGFASAEDEHERITCLVEQGFTPCKCSTSSSSTSIMYNMPLTSCT